MHWLPLFTHYFKFNMNNEKRFETILTISIGFLILFLIFKHNTFLHISLVVGIIGLLSSYLSKIIVTVWFTLAEVLGMIVPKIVLGLVFYLFLFPISLLAKIGKRDILMLSKKYQSYFVDRIKKAEKSDFEKTW